MHQALRPYVTAGVAVLGAGMIAVPPMAVGSVVGQAPAVQLTAGFLDTWQGVLDTSSANFTTLYNNFALAPMVGLQQLIVNQQALWDEVADGTKTAEEAFTQIQDNIAMLGSAFTLDVDTADDAGKAIWDAVTPHTLEGLRSTMVGLLPGFLPEDSGIDPEQVTDILQFLSSPLSAMLIGSLVPGISPLVALGNSVTEISDAMTGEDPDFEAAFNGMLNIPANMVNGFLNGADLDLGALLPAINDAGVLPEGMEMTALEIAFGGLLSPGIGSGAGDGGIYTFPDGTEVPAVGGSIFNSIGLSMTGVPIINDLTLDSHAIGPIAAMEQWSQVMGVLLGDAWDGKGAEQIPPISGLDPLVLDDAGSGFASLFGDLLSDI